MPININISPQQNDNFVGRYLQFYQPMVLNSLVVSLVPVAILSLQVDLLSSKSDDILLFYQSQLDTDGQGVLKNIGLTSARISIAGTFTVALNMIIKVSIWRRI